MRRRKPDLADLEREATDPARAGAVVEIRLREQKQREMKRVLQLDPRQLGRCGVGRWPIPDRQGTLEASVS